MKNNELIRVQNATTGQVYTVSLATYARMLFFATHKYIVLTSQKQ